MIEIIGLTVHKEVLHMQEKLLILETSKAKEWLKKIIVGTFFSEKAWISIWHTWTTLHAIKKSKKPPLRHPLIIKLRNGTEKNKNLINLCQNAKWRLKIQATCSQRYHINDNWLMEVTPPESCTHTHAHTRKHTCEYLHRHALEKKSSVKHTLLFLPGSHSLLVISLPFQSFVPLCDLTELHRTSKHTHTLHLYNSFIWLSDNLSPRHCAAIIARSVKALWLPVANGPCALPHSNTMNCAVSHWEETSGAYIKCTYMFVPYLFGMLLYYTFNSSVILLMLNFLFFWLFAFIAP